MKYIYDTTWSNVGLFGAYISKEREEQRGGKDMYDTS